MGIPVTTLLSPPAPVLVDFGWYYESGGSPLRDPPYSYQSNLVGYPPGHTSLSNSVNAAASDFTMRVTSTANFDILTSGQVLVNNGTQWTLFSYDHITGNTFVKCNAVAGTTTITYPTATLVWDPRFYVDSAPLQTIITFDARDTLNQGLNQTIIPPNIKILQWRWDFGNGQAGFGPVAKSIYPFDSPPPSVHVTLTVLDSISREFSCSHPLILVSPGPPLAGSATRY